MAVELPELVVVNDEDVVHTIVNSASVNKFLKGKRRKTDEQQKRLTASTTRCGSCGKESDERLAIAKVFFADDEEEEERQEAEKEDDAGQWLPVKTATPVGRTRSGSILRGSDIYQHAPVSQGQKKRKMVHFQETSPSQDHQNASSRKRKSDQQEPSEYDASTSANSETDEDEEEANSRKKSATVRSSLYRSLQLTNPEAYFSTHAENCATSDNTLSRLGKPGLDLEMIKEGLSRLPSAHKRQQQELLAQHRMLFNTWMLQLMHGHNIILYGFGSKRQVLAEFCEQLLSETTHLVINGYFPGLQFKNVLRQLSEDLLGCRDTFRNVLEHSHFICQRFGGVKSGSVREVFLIIHNIDGVGLRSEKIQTCLSLLAQASNVHVLATMDHINTPVMWDAAKLGRFSWLWYEVHTFAHYMEEASYENSLVVQQSAALEYSSLIHVLQSLTSNGRGVFNLLGKTELEMKNDSSYQGMPFQELYAKAREQFLVSNDQALRAQLTEFFDHKLIKSKKGRDGIQYLTVCVPSAVLERYYSANENG